MVDGSHNRSCQNTSPSGRSRGVPSRQASGSESLRPTVPPVFRPSSPSGLSEASAAQGAPLDISRGPTNLRSDSFIRSVVSRFGSSQSGNKKWCSALIISRGQHTCGQFLFVRPVVLGLALYSQEWHTTFFKHGAQRRSFLAAPQTYVRFPS